MSYGTCTLKIGQAASIMLGDTVLGHITTNNLSDEADMEDKDRRVIRHE